MRLLRVQNAISVPMCVATMSNLAQMQLMRTVKVAVARPCTAPFRCTPLKHSRGSFIVTAASLTTQGITTQEEILPNSSVRLTVVVPADMCKKAYRSVLRTWNNKIAITGYRKGHAPESVLIDQLGGPQRVNNTVLTELIEDVMGTALERTPSASRAIADSERIEQTGEELEGSFDPDNDFTFSVVFDILPSVTWTTPYRNLAVSVVAASDDDRDAAIVEKKMRAVLKEGGKLRVVAGRGVTLGDVAIVDFSAAIADTGEAIPGCDRQGMQLDTETGDEAFLPGVAQAMAGMMAGEERGTTLTFPSDESFTPASLRGVTAAVKIKVSEVFEWDLPEVNDEWAEAVLGPGSTVADVRARLLENTQAESEDATRQRVADALTDAVAAAVHVDIPEALIQEAGQNEYSRELNQLISQGVITYQQAEQLATPQMVAGYISRKKTELINLQKAALGFAEILAKEGLAPSTADVERELAATLAALEPVQGENLNVDGVKEQVIRGLETQAAMDWLVANCNVTVVPPLAA